MKKTVKWDQVNEAIRHTRDQATGYDDWYRGYAAGASAVGVRLVEIQHRDEAVKAARKEAGLP